MNVNAIMLREEDKVITVVGDVKKGDTVNYKKGDESCQVIAAEDIPSYHKIAIVDLKKDEEVIKYGQIIGAMMADAEKGCWISHKNVMSLPRNYEEEL